MRDMVHVIIVYDGKCPLCRFGVNHVAIDGELVTGFRA